MGIKIVRHFFAVFLFLALLTGCEGKKVETFDIFGNDTPPEKLKKVTLTILVPGKKNSAVDAGFAAIESASEESLNVHIVPVFVDLNTFRFLGDLAGIMEKNPCDLVYIAGINVSTRFPGGGDVLRPLYDAGLLTDLTDAFPRWAPNYFAELAPETLVSYVRDGKILAIPNNVIIANRPSAAVREDFFNAGSLVSLGGISDFETYLDSVRQREGNSVVPLAISDDLSLMSIFANALGYAILDEETQLVYRWDDPDMKVMAWEDIPEMGEIAARVDSWYRKGWFKRRKLYENLDLLMDAPGWGAWIAPDGSAYRMNHAIAALGRDFRYLDFPLFPDARVQRLDTYYEGFAIPASSKNAERALMFVEWAHQGQDHYDMVRYGIKGKDYDLDGDRLVFPENVPSGEAFLDWQSGPLLDYEYERLPVAGAGDASSVAYPPHGSFRLEKNGVKALATRKRFYKGLDEILSWGEYSADALAEYRKTQKENGIDAAVAAAQTQLNEWRETH